MRAAIFTLLILTVSAFSQQKTQVTQAGTSDILELVNGSIVKRTVTVPVLYSSNPAPVNSSQGQQYMLLNNSLTRWQFTDPIAIGDRVEVSGNGLYQIVGWGLNTERISHYGNTNSTPFWEFYSDPNVGINHVAISDTGGIIANGSYKNIYLFNRTSSTPFFNFDLTTLPDTGNAGPVDITSDGRFLVASASRNDSSTVFGFWKDSANWVWRFRVGPTSTTGAGIMGARISGNDSLIIVNTYGSFYILRTYTGQLVYQGLINPSSVTSGTQSPQGISGNGSFVATINYYGFLRVYQWSGSTYNLLWQHQEPPGTYYNWMYSVDVSYDGSMVACGTLNFITSSSYDGKVKFFRTANGSTPVWTYTGCGDNVTSVSFSKNGKILTAASWGDMGNAYNDLLVFKTSVNAPAPIFGVNSVGSFFWCSTSDDGSTVTGSGKRVHARTFGNGGQLYNIYIDTSDNPLGLTGNTPDEYNLQQNFPNPFNPATQINYSIARNGYVRLSVHDMLGREVAVPVDAFIRAGNHSVVFEASGLSSGVYIYRLRADGFTDVKKMILLK